MGRLIDAESLWTDIMMLPHNGDIISSDEVEQAIADAPTIDAVEVVRCKNCKNCVVRQEQIVIGEAGKRYPIYYCHHWDYDPIMSPNLVDGDDFCSYGERRSDEDTKIH